MSALEQRTRRDHIIFVMGRGKQWTVPETKALLEAFIHISEDAVVGTDQSSERLYQRVSDEAKTRYQGDWMRTGDAADNSVKHMTSHAETTTEFSGVIGRILREVVLQQPSICLFSFSLYVPLFANR